MARPKSNTLAGKIASARWRQTMNERYGSVHEKMVECGRLGGCVCSPLKGFGGNHERAVWAGRIGGTISRKGKK